MTASTGDQRHLRRAIAIIVALVLLRLVASAWTPLTFDEAYYWTWSKSLAGGYYDHPPLVAVVIRLGTMLAGDTELGVRLVSVLLALPMSWAVYRAGQMLFSTRVGIDAALMLNATMLASVGLMIVTPDAPVLLASSFVLYTLAKVQTSDRGTWWLAVGVAVGVALLSKYTSLFFGVVILLWLLLAPTMRRWLASPWPYLGGVVAFVVFSPVLIWNAEHHWVSFLKQLVGRARVEGFKPVYLAELIPTQIAFATPLVFVLGVMGLYLLARRRDYAPASRVLINATFWTISLYFVWHAVHSRVEANWFAPVYPAFAVAAAVAIHGAWSASTQRRVGFCARWAVPGGAVLFVLLVVQANTGVLGGYRRDATVRSVGVGMAELARDIEAVRQRVGATCVLVPDYGTTGWLKFYMPAGSCVEQLGQRIRWINMPAPDPARLSGKMLLVGWAQAGASSELRSRFGTIDQVVNLKRMRGPLLVEHVEVNLAAEPVGDVLDQTPPPELQR